MKNVDADLFSVDPKMCFFIEVDVLGTQKIHNLFLGGKKKMTLQTNSYPYINLTNKPCSRPSTYYSMFSQLLSSS
jgi:hypothetical protein